MFCQNPHLPKLDSVKLVEFCGMYSPSVKRQQCHSIMELKPDQSRKLDAPRSSPGLQQYAKALHFWLFFVAFVAIILHTLGVQLLNGDRLLASVLAAACPPDAPGVCEARWTSARTLPERSGQSCREFSKQSFDREPFV